jgi:hypothetical protein
MDEGTGGSKAVLAEGPGAADGTKRWRELRGIGGEGKRREEMRKDAGKDAALQEAQKVGRSVRGGRWRGRGWIFR